MFKIGDKVKLLDNIGREFIPIGTVFTVLNIKESDWNPGQLNLFVSLSAIGRNITLGLRQTRFQKVSSIQRNLPSWW